MSARPRLLVVDAADTRGRVYGAQTVIQSLVEQSVERYTWSAAVTQDEGAYPDRLRELGVDVRGLPLRSRLGVARRALAELLAELRPALVHTHDLRASAIARGPALQAGVPVVTTYHENLLYDHLHGLTRLKRQAMIAAERRTAARSARSICVSRAVEQEVTRALALDAARVRIVPNGVDSGALQQAATPAAVAAARATAGLQEDELAVVVVGALVERKGQFVLVQAIPAILAQQPATRFVFVGDGPDRERLEAQAEALEVSAQCRFVGFQPAVAPFMALADVVAAPSLGEAFGLVALEAMALGRPVVASAVGGLPEVVSDGETGWLVPPASVEALAAVLIALLGEPAARQRLGEQGRVVAEQRFSVAETARATRAVYDEVFQP